MKLLEYFNKIRNLSVDDSIDKGKKILIILVITIPIILLAYFLVSTIKGIVMKHTYKEEVYEDKPIPYEEKVESSVYTPNKVEEIEINELQKKEYAEYNKVQFSEVNVTDNFFNVTATNTFASEISGLNIILIKEDGSVATSTEGNANIKLKSNEKQIIDGFTYETDLKIGGYSFFLNNEYYTVDLLNEYVVRNHNIENGHL